MKQRAANRPHPTDEGNVRKKLEQTLRECGLSGCLLSEDETAARMQDTCLHARSEQSLVLTIHDKEEVVRSLSHARTIGATVHPVSSGHNWGYGTARPGRGAADLILDLSPMNKILSFDDELGIVRVEPGVTQGQLAAFLTEKGARFMVPTTGAGPDCSLIGNALERGYGMTPISDHFQAVLGIAAITGEGRIYRSALQKSDAPTPYRWGVGPYLDGIFSQSGGAVVTEMVLQLKPRPERVEMFVFWLSEASALGGTVEAMRTLCTQSGLEIGGINLMNSARIEAMAGASATRGCPWVGTGVVFGRRQVVRAGRGVIRKALRGQIQALRFINEDTLRMARLAAGLPPLARLIPAKLLDMVRSVEAAHEVLSGHPNAFALQLAYTGSDRPFPKAGIGANPAQDGCGLLWYAPIVPMRGDAAHTYVDFVTRTCAAHDFLPPITFSTLSASAFDSTVPLLFPRDAENSARAMTCLRALISQGRKLGFEPYRFHADLMDEATSAAPDHWWLAERVRAALDPDRLISPGRYAPSNDTFDRNPDFIGGGLH
ncbi:FAD-binding oxidoreductase [uncultured Celeribacter sp.]|uniref:FAD-binding oxidoreductase n=1 Tax=uncultured Celeribacter sp. TaxID=1303376 RepID=UPI002AA5E3A1|nr:FAD-binding oxidoreductase [uncultured Celeribacter sp.]